MDKCFFAVVAIFALPSLFSCTNKGNIFGCSVDVVSPEHEASCVGEEVHIAGGPIVGATNLYVYDSLLIVKGTAKDEAGQMFLYSLDDGRYCGNFVDQGRGQNELLSPIFGGIYESSEGYDLIYLFDLQRSEAYAFDAGKSVQTGDTHISKICALPAGTMYAYGLNGSLHFVKITQPDGMTGQLLDRDGAVLKSVPLYSELSGVMYLDKLSSSDAFLDGSKTLAMAMIMLPQVNFIDIDSGQSHTSATSRSYKSWEKIFQKDITQQTVYYTAICTSEEYVIALYCGVPLVDWAKGDIADSHLHIFNSGGEFVYDVALDSKLKAMSYDGHSGTLYGIDLDDRILKYDLSACL